MEIISGHGAKGIMPEVYLPESFIKTWNYFDMIVLIYVSK